MASLLLGYAMCNVVYAEAHRLANGEVLNDPTKPQNWHHASGPEAQQAQFNLSYILKTSKRTKAIINGKKVSEGDSVSGARIIKINQNTVLMSVDGKRRVLHLTTTGSIRK